MLKSNTNGAEDGFSGDSTLYLADATWKWAPEGNFKDGGVTVRGEYFLVDRDGDIDQVPRTWTAITMSQFSGVMFQMAASRTMPALFTTMSRRP